jgi:hypothetical protein
MNNDRLLFATLTLFVSASFMDKCSSCVAWGQTQASSQSTTTEYIQRLKRFHIIAGVIGPAPEKMKDIAQTMADALESEVKQFPGKKSLLAYYVAKSHDVLGHSETAAQWAMPVSKDLEDPNCAEARSLLFCNGYYGDGSGRKFDKLKTSKEDMVNALEAFYSAYQDGIIEIYPKGYEAARILNKVTQKANTESFGDITKPSNKIKRIETETRAAGDMYMQMNMYSEAIVVYKEGAGFLDEWTWMEPLYAPLWMSIGDCYASTGRPDLAARYYVKSLACGQPLADVTPKIRQAQTETRPTETKATVTAKPDAPTLEKIAARLAGTELFDEAIEAAVVAEKLRGTKSALLSSLHQRKADWMRMCLNMTKEGVIVRGVLITTEAIKQEEALGRQPGN